MERDSKRIIKRMLAEGFVRVSVKGSHHKFRNGARVVVVPHPKRYLPLGTARNIALTAGWLNKEPKQ